MKDTFLFFALVLISASIATPGPFCLTDCLGNTCAANCTSKSNISCGVCTQISSSEYAEINCGTDAMTMYNNSDCAVGHAGSALTPLNCTQAYNALPSPNCTGNCTIVLYADVFCIFPALTFTANSTCRSFSDTLVVFQSLRFNCSTNKVDFYDGPNCTLFAFSKAPSPFCDILTSNTGPALIITCTTTLLPSIPHYIDYGLCPPGIPENIFLILY